MTKCNLKSLILAILCAMTSSPLMTMVPWGSKPSNKYDDMCPVQKPSTKYAQGDIVKDEIEINNPNITLKIKNLRTPIGCQGILGSNPGYAYTKISDNELKIMNVIK